MNRKYRFFIALFFVATTAQISRTYAEETVEHQLAVIDAKGFVAEDDITVARFRSLLEQLSSTYDEDKQKIADMTVTARGLLRKNGIDEKVLNIMEGMNQLFSGKAENQKYSQMLAYYVAFRNKGMTHADAIENLRGIIQTLLNAGG
jgi:hypothetical protein